MLICKSVTINYQHYATTKATQFQHVEMHYKNSIMHLLHHINSKLQDTDKNEAISLYRRQFKA